MAITFVGAGSVTSNSNLIGTTGIALTPNASTLTDDLMIAFMHRNQDDGSYDTPPSGWTLWASESTSAGQDMQTQICYKIATSDSESAATFTHSDTTGEQWAGCIITFRGVDTTTPIDTAYVSGSHFIARTNKATTNVDAFQTISVTTDQACVVALEAVTHDDITSDADPASYTNAVRHTGGAQDFRQFQIWYRLGLSTGNETPGAPAYTSNAAVAESHQYTIAVRPSSGFSESPDTGALTLTGQTPARGSGFRLGGLGPTVSIDAVGGGITEEPGTGSTALSGETPTVATTANHWIDVDSGSLALTGEIPVVVVSLSAYPTLGAVDITGEIPLMVQTFNHIRAPPLGAVVLTGEVPTVQRTENHFPLPGTGSLALTGQAPTLDQTENHFVDPSVGALALTGYIPAAGQFLAEAPDAGSIALTGYLPSLTYSWTNFPDTGGVALTGYIPSPEFSWVVYPDVDSLSIAGYAPSVQSSVTIYPDTGSIALTGYAPTIEFSWTVYPDAGSLALTGEIPLTSVSSGQNTTIEVGAGSLNLKGFSRWSILRYSVDQWYSNHRPTARQDEGAQPDTAVLTCTGYAPIASENATVEISPGELTLTTYLEYNYGGPGLRLIGYEPEVIAFTEQGKPGVGSLALTGQVPTITVNHIVEPAEDTLVLTGAAPTATLSGDVTAAINFTSALDITGLAPTIDRSVDTVSPEPGSLTLTGYDLALFTTEPHSINPGTGSLSLTGYLEYNYGGPGLRLISYEPTIDNTSTPPEPPVSPDTLDLSFETHAPAIEITIDGGFEQLILTGYAPTISESTDHTPVPGTGGLALNGFSPSPQLGAPPNISIPVQTGSLNLTGEVPTISFSWTVYPDTGSIGLTGYAGTHDTLLTIQIPAVPELSITGQAPNAHWGPDVGELTLTGQQPKLTILPNVPAGEPGSLTCTGHAPFAFRRQAGGASKEELRELGAKRKKEQDLRKETLKRVEEHKEELAEKIFGEEPSVIKEILETGKGEVSGIEVEIDPLQPPQFPIDELAPQLEQIKDGMDREIASLIRTQEEAKFKRELAEHQLKVQRMEEELIAFLILAMDD